MLSGVLLPCPAGAGSAVIMPKLYGGGVYAQEFGNFRMADGIIYGSDAVAGLANTLIDENSGLGAAFRGLFAKRCQRVGFL